LFELETQVAQILWLQVPTVPPEIKKYPGLDVWHTFEALQVPQPVSQGVMHVDESLHVAHLL